MFLLASVGIFPGVGVSLRWGVGKNVGSGGDAGYNSGKVTVLLCSWVGKLQVTHLCETPNLKGLNFPSPSNAQIQHNWRRATRDWGDWAGERHEGYLWGGHGGLGITKEMLQGDLPIPSCSRLYLLLADPTWSRQGAMEGRWSTLASACWTRGCTCGKIRKAYQIVCSSETA